MRIHLPGLRVLAILGLPALCASVAPSPVSADCFDPPSGITAWWTFDDAGASSLGNLIAGVPEGIVHGSPASVSAPGSRGLFFDGIDDYVEVPSHPAFDLDRGDFSIVGWIRAEDSRSIATSILDRRDSQNGSGFRGINLYLYEGSLGLQLADGRVARRRTYTNYSSEAAVADGAWHAFAVTVDRDATDGGHWYVDAQPQGTFDPRDRGSSLSASAPLHLGRRTVTSPGWFRGSLDELMIFDRALTAQEVRYLARLGPGGACKTEATLECTVDKYPSTMVVGQKQTFSGTVDADDFVNCGYLAQWTSDLDGSLGPGLSIAPTLTVGSHEVCLLASGLSGDCSGEVCTRCVGVEVEKRPVEPPVPAGTWCGRDAAWWTEEIASGRRGYRNEMATMATEVRGDEEELSELILGNAQANLIEGEAGDDCIYGFGGDDRLHGDRTGIPGVSGDGRSGKDEIHGGDGNDSIWGDAKDDRLFGDAGDDRLKGDSGADLVVGGPGSDFVMGDSGSDRLRGGDGDDRLCGNSGRDALDGGAGKDACRVGSGRKESRTACESSLRRKDCTAKTWRSWQPGQSIVPSCPGFRKKLGELDAKPVCKALPHFSIKTKRCSKKGGGQWNGYCVWDKGSWYRARKLK